ncbi:MAG: erythromycin esterase family protein [Acidobacteriota bacterium]
MSRMRIGAAVILGLTLLSVSGWAQPADPANAANTGARKKPPKPRGYPVLPGVYRLNGGTFELPQEDLEPLRQIVGNATIVSLGESVHTSGGYYEMKHRLFRFLVEKMGFRAFAFETPWDDADNLAHYVETCEGTPEQGMRGIFGVWQSAETADLMQWMCEWNKSHKKSKDKVHFFGFDVQQPDLDGPALLAFLERLDVGAEDPRAADVWRCNGVASPPTYDGRLSETEHQACLRGLDAVQTLFDEEGPSIVERTSAVDFEYARLRLVGLRSWEGQAYYNGLDDYPGLTQSRDSGMAYAFRTLRRLRYGEKIKTAVWAHNFHIAKDAARSAWNTPTMGTYLREAFGSSYAAIALISDVTEIDWRGIGCGPLQVLRGDRAVEQLLGELGHDYLLVDLDFPGGSPAFLGAGETYRFSEVGMVPADQYDAAVFLERSHKMDPLRWASCTP